MRTLAEIDHQPNLPHDGKIVCREAVRAIILRGRELLMVHSQVNGDYKFPGGGIKHEEQHEDALVREVAEESGGRVLKTPQPFGKVLEFDFPIEKRFDGFCMTSYYYLCEVDPVLGQQNLDEYELRLGFVPVWVDIDVALKNNRAIQMEHACRPERNKYERWVKRETCMLEIIKQELFSDR